MLDTECYERKIIEYQQEAQVFQATADVYQEKAKISLHKVDLERELLVLSREEAVVQEEQKETAQQQADSVFLQEKMEHPIEWDYKAWDSIYQNDYGIKLSEAETKEARELYGIGNWTINALTWKYHASYGNIHHILTGHVWSHAGGPLFSKPVRNVYSSMRYIQ